MDRREGGHHAQRARRVPPQMPLDETLYIMELMDGLRKEWDVRYPMDEIDWK